ncbi:DUF4232 domain-containing protein [Streptomyces colonosanans]|uniref:DUF4232 domain-containing protein n=1 Tax=Streptomyces colonosanans TaxID=1428652 RepID=A0A1S2NW00_9ACTN|nr:DUF4232 domain-containing protein [Streptomyces colonosanans]OIJ85650.1 hypothetical protein BIV24_27930 [Streptomyces colonosanans]
MTAKLNRAARCTAAVLAVIAVGAGATACDAPSSRADARSGAAKDSSSGQQGGSQDTAQHSSAADVKKTARQGSRTDAVNVSSATTSKRCHTGELRYSWGSAHGGAPDMNDTTDQQIAAIRLKNSGGRTCTLRGFPGVRLISKSGDAWDLRRSADKPSTITLRPGDDTALITMSILPVAKNDPDTKPFVPSKVLITPPNETSHVTLDWPYGGAILDQSGATHPGTFVNSISVG